LAAVTAVCGTVSGLLHHPATPTRRSSDLDDGFSGAGSVSVTGASYTDAAGNTGAAGSDSVTIDRLNPTVLVDVVATSLSDTTSSSEEHTSVLQSRGEIVCRAVLAAVRGTV